MIRKERRNMKSRIGIIGTGRRGKDHIRQLVKRDDVVVTAVCDIVREVAEEAARIAGAPRIYVDYREMLDKETLDAVIVATPAPVHAGPAVLALQKGLNVMCEKPLAWSLRDALRIVDAAQASRGLCEVGYQYRHNPAVGIALERLGGSGIALVRGFYYHTVPLVESIKDVRTGGGQIFDQVTHLIDLSRVFAGDVVKVYSRYTRNARGPEEFNNWDGYAVTYEYKSGAVGNFSSTYALFLGHGEPPTLDIIGREVLVRFAGSKLIVVTPKGREEFGPETEGFTVTTDIIGDFVTAVATGDRSLIKSPPGDAINSLAATIAANLSAQTGQIISTDELIERARSGEEVPALLE